MNKLKNQTPYFFNKEQKKQQLINNLETIFYQIEKYENISKGDLPDIKQFQNNLRNYDWSKMYYYKTRLINDIDNLSDEISYILSETKTYQDKVSIPKTNGLLTDYTNSLFGSISCEGYCLFK